MKAKNPSILGATTDNIDAAAAALRAGQLVAFATETVYGLGADACNETAVESIYAAKGRPSNNPLISHVADRETAERFVNFTTNAALIADHFWPGPLTLVLPKKPNTAIAPLVSAGLDTLAIRLPAHAMARQLLRAFDGPVAAPSANPSGKISPTAARHVTGLKGDHLAMVLDGGDCAVGLESTIVGFDEDDMPVVLRPGFITSDALTAATGLAVASVDIQQKSTDILSAPGQMVSHYAPEKPVYLHQETAPSDHLHIGFGAIAQGDLSLSPTGDLEEAARNLFRQLHAADALPGTGISVAPVPHHGLGIAINDRLRRAAAPKD